MNMLTSLKALLFSSAATAVPAEGVGALAAPVEGAPDFASLLNGTMEAVADAPAATPVLTPMAGLTGTVAEGATQAEAVSPLPHGLANALNAIETHRKASLPLPPGIAKKVEEAAPGMLADRLADSGASAPAEAGATGPVVTDSPLPQADDGLETPVAEVEEADPIQTAEKPQKPPKSRHLAEKARMAEVAPPVIAQQAEAPDAEPDNESRSEDKPVEQRSDPVAAAPVPTPAPVVIVTPQSAPQQQSNADGQLEDVRAAPARRAAPVPSVAAETPAPAVADMPVPAPFAPSPRLASQGQMPSKPEASPAQSAAVMVMADGPVQTDQPDAPAPPTLAQPVKSEALALLQLVRDQLGARQPGAPARVGERVSAAARTKVERAAPVSEATASTPIQPVATDATPQPALSQPSVPTAAQPSAAAQPVADLSASLGAQVVDMGVSGQWIDGLARDIAGLSANGAQGRFQIHADQLGPVQVDIRHGTDGAAVSLTVASEAAEMALRQDSDRLRLDASLSAVRISEVKIERAPHVAEAARADSANQQSSQQQPSPQQSSQTANAWANNSQNMAQSQGQGRWQARENNGFTPKNSGDPAVLNHDEPRRAANDAARARYA